MADETKTPKHPADKAKGAGTSDPTAPGGADFDVDNASDEEFEKHSKILERRSKVASLSPAPVPVTVVDPLTTSAPVPAPAGVTKTDTRNGNEQTLPEKTWALLPAEDKAFFEDAPAQVTKPKDI